MRGGELRCSTDWVRASQTISDQWQLLGGMSACGQMNWGDVNNSLIIKALTKDHSPR